MAGGFSHVTAAMEAVGRLKTISGLTNANKRMLTQFTPLIEVGAVGPDYPYLGMQSGWADAMHYQETGQMIRNGAMHIRTLPPGEGRNVSLAWLLGYTAHVATDLTIHPVVELLVGEYATHKPEHRTCEMHQDAFIWQRHNLGGIGLADYFAGNIRRCSTQDGALITPVKELWTHMLEQTYPDFFRTTPPRIGDWHFGFKTIVDAIDDIGTLFPFTRHTMAQHAMAYPAVDDIDPSYIVNIETPEGNQHYDKVFERAVNAIATVWSTVGKAINAASDNLAATALQDIPDGNLDTGRMLTGGRLVFWGN